MNTSAATRWPAWHPTTFHRARVIGLCSDTTGTGPFTNPASEVMTQEPYASARRVFRVVDNGSSHRGQAAIDRLTARCPSTVMIHTPGARLLAQPGCDLLHRAAQSLPTRTS
jgi:hypothetical protein